MHLDCRGEGSSNRNASRDESVETGDESVETRGDESIEAGEKTQQSCYNIKQCILSMETGPRHTVIAGYRPRVQDRIK